MKIAKDMDLNLEVHVSTQLSTLNLKADEFLQKWEWIGCFRT